MNWKRLIQFAAIVVLGFTCYLLGRYGADDSVHDQFRTKPERPHPTVENEGVERPSNNRGGLSDLTETESFSGDTEFADLFARLNLLEDLPGKDYILFQLLGGWGELDSSAAMDSALSLSLGKQGIAIRSVLMGWAKKDSEAAWRWVSNRPDSKYMRKVGWYRAVMREMINQGDFDMGIHLISSMGEGEGDPRTKEILTQQLMKNWLAKDGESALQWIDQMPEGPSSEGALKAFAEDWATKDGLEATEWALSMENQEGILTSAILAWTRNGEPIEVAQWLKGQSPSAEMDSAISIFVRATVRKDPELAQAMINSIRDNDTRDGAVLALARGQNGPGESLRWLDTHLSGNRSEVVRAKTSRMVEMFAQQWAENDWNAATAYVQNSTLLTGEERSKILQTLQRAR